MHRRRRVFVALVVLNLVELAGVFLVGPGFWIRLLGVVHPCCWRTSSTFAAGFRPARRRRRRAPPSGLDRRTAGRRPARARPPGRRHDSSPLAGVRPPPRRPPGHASSRRPTPGAITGHVRRALSPPVPHLAAILAICAWFDLHPRAFLHRSRWRRDLVRGASGLAVSLVDGLGAVAQPGSAPRSHRGVRGSNPSAPPRSEAISTPRRWPF